MAWPKNGVTNTVVRILLSVEKRRYNQQYNKENFLEPHSQGSIPYQESEKW
jgi:hypothetical protein